MTKILIVEDEESILMPLEDNLRLEGYEVASAADGLAGLTMAVKDPYDLIILDIMLPGMNDLDLCKEIRKKGIQSPVMMLTARDSIDDKVTGLDSGADDYLTKPFSFEEFLARVRALLRRKQDKLTELTYGHLKIDTLAHRAFADGTEVMLRPKEYAILVYLLRNRGRVLSRTQILENVWGYDFNPNTNIVDVHIKALREKLDEVNIPSLIRSVRGVGYMIDS